ncbi:MAG: tetratricopeptide repeat protein [bacterium]
MVYSNITIPGLCEDKRKVRIDFLIRALSSRGTIYDLFGYYNKAISDFRVIYRYDAYRTVADFGISEVLEKMGKYHQALDYVERALELCSDIPRKIEIINQKAFLLMRLGDLKNAKRTEESVQALIRKNRGNITDINNYAGRSYYNLSVFSLLAGKLTSALEFAKKSLKIAFINKDKRRQALSYNLLGVIYKKMNKPDFSQKYYQKSLSYFTEIGDIGQIAGVYNNIGNLQNDSQTAISYFKKALTIFTRINYSMGIAETMHNIANSYLALGICKKALAEYTKAHRLTKKMSYRFGMSINLTGIGKSYKLLGDYKSAQNCISKALSLAEEMDDREGILENHYMIALIKYEQNDKDTPVWFRKARHLAEELSSYNFLAEIIYGEVKYLISVKDNDKIIQLKKRINKLLRVKQDKRTYTFLLLSKFMLQDYRVKRVRDKQVGLWSKELEKIFEQTTDREMIFYLGRTLVDFYLINDLRKACSIYSILNRLIPEEEMKSYYSEVIFLGAKIDYHLGKNWQNKIRKALSLARTIGNKRLIEEIQNWLKSIGLTIILKDL